VPGIELLEQDAVPSGPAGTGGPRQGKNECAVGHAGKRTGLDGRGTDLLVGEIPEELTEAIDRPVEQGLDRLRRDVTAGHTGPTRDEHAIDARLGDPAGHLGAHLIDIVGEDTLVGPLVAGLGQGIDEVMAGGVIGLGPAIGNR